MNHFIPICQKWILRTKGVKCHPKVIYIANKWQSQISSPYRLTPKYGLVLSGYTSVYHELRHRISKTSGETYCQQRHKNHFEHQQRLANLQSPCSWELTHQVCSHNPCSLARQHTGKDQWQLAGSRMRPHERLPPWSPASKLPHPCCQMDHAGTRLSFHYLLVHTLSMAHHPLKLSLLP